MNTWVEKKWDKLSTKRRGPGGRDVHETLLPYPRFLAMLQYILVRKYVEEVERQHSEMVRKRQQDQNSQQLAAWQGDAIRFVIAPLVRLHSGNLRHAAEDIVHREPLAEVWRVFSASGIEPAVEDVEQALSDLRFEPRGPKKNIGLIVKDARGLLKKRL